MVNSMSEVSVQASFNSGEWSPALFARVDITKYKSGAALLENFFVDYRGGASTRTGTKYIIQAYKSSTQVRLITFQAAFNVGYVIEIGNGYMRFIYQGAPVVETAFTISSATQANPCVLTIVGNNYNVGDWIFVNNIIGMTQLNGRYFQVTHIAGNSVTIANLEGVAINSTTYTAYTSGGTAARIYTIASPYTNADDLRLIKFAGSISQMILCHPNHPAYVLTLVAANNWTLSQIMFGTTASPPIYIWPNTSLAAGSVNYSYVVTSIDEFGQESAASATAVFYNIQDIRTVAGTNSLNWSAVTGAVAYNVYEAYPSYYGVVPAGATYGFIGTTTGLRLDDSNITPDFSQTPPIVKNPFTGSGVTSVTVNTAGTYTNVPLVTFIGSATIPAQGAATLSVNGTPTISAGGTGYAVNDFIEFSNGLLLQATTVSGGGAVTAWSVISPGTINSGATPSNPIAQVTTTGGGTGATATATWGVSSVYLTLGGAGYLTAPTITFSSGAAAATATIGSTTAGYPQVPSFCQQRLILAGSAGAPQTFYMSQPGSYFNFNITDPVQSNNAITGTLVSNTLNSIKSILSTTAGMLILTDKASWIVNGGSSGSAITPTSIVANAQSFVGASDVPPIVANYDILYVQSKGAAIRDLAFNIYFNIFTGSDISVLSSHLFYGYTILEWAWAEQPFYVIWAVRSDGVLLSLTFLKEQDFIGWAHHDTPGGTFQSVTAVTESGTPAGTVDAVYTVVQRTINGNVVQYIERFAERIFPNGLASAWTVDCGLQYSGAAATAFQGAEFLAGQTVTGLATDSLGNTTIITPFAMPVSGQFTLPVPPVAPGYTTVTIGLGFTANLQTLPLDINGPSIQGKTKKINSVDVRVKDTLGLSIGPDTTQLNPMRDLIVGNVSSTLTGQNTGQVVTGLVTGDAHNYLSPAYTVPGQYYIRQSQPYPATVLGVFPTITIGDD